MSALAKREASASGVRLRALSQLARELMLAQSSDWPFLIRMGTAKEYARARFERHEAAFRKLEGMISGRESWDEPALVEMESKDNLFPGIDPQWWV
jgi:1,4-alpha-glucan branching enzyme